MVRAIDDRDFEYCVRLMLQRGYRPEDCREDVALFFDANVMPGDIMQGAEYQRLKDLFLRATLQRTLMRLASEGFTPDVIGAHIEETAKSLGEELLRRIEARAK